MRRGGKGVAALVALAVLALAPSGATAKTRAAAKSGADAPRGPGDRVIGGIHSKPVRDPETNMLDYGELRPGAHLTTHGPDPIDEETEAQTQGATDGGEGDDPPETSPTGFSQIDHALDPILHRNDQNPPPVPPRVPLQCASGAYTFNVLYYVPSGGQNRYSERIETIRDEIANAERRLEEAVWEFNPFASEYRRFRIRTDSACESIVTTVQGTQSQLNFGAVVGDIRAQGYDGDEDNNGVMETKYLLFPEGGTLCGEANLYRDDWKDMEGNKNNLETSFAIVWPACRDGDGSTALHEMTHAVGGVQPSAPNNNTATPGSWMYHCTDEEDRMCQDEAGGEPTQTVCAGEEKYDCGRDDYFHVNPPTGNYLLTHFNLATESRYIDRPGDTRAPVLDPDIDVRDESDINATDLIPFGLPHPDAIQGYYKVHFKAAASDNVEVAFRLGRSARRPWDPTGKCPADGPGVYPVKTWFGVPMRTGERQATLDELRGGLVVRGGCYKFFVRAEDPSGHLSTASGQVLKVSTPQDHVLEPVKDNVPRPPEPVPWWLPYS